MRCEFQFAKITDSEMGPLQFETELRRASDSPHLTKAMIMGFADIAGKLPPASKAQLRCFLNENLWKLDNLEFHAMISEGQHLLTESERELLKTGTGDWDFYYVHEKCTENQLELIADTFADQKRFHDLLVDNALIYSRGRMRVTLLGFMQTSNVIRKERIRREASPKRKAVASSKQVSNISDGSPSSDSSYEAQESSD